MSDLVQSVWVEFWHSSPLAKLGYVATFAGFFLGVVGFPWASLKLRRATASARAAAAAEQKTLELVVIERQARELAEQDAQRVRNELAEARARQPDHWLADADGTIQPTGHVSDRLGEAEPAIGSACAQVASTHLSDYDSTGSATSIDEALRLARLAYLHHQHHAGTGLLHEVELAHSLHRVRSGNMPDPAEYWTQVEPVGAIAWSPMTFVTRLAEAAHRSIDTGDLVEALTLARRSRAIARRDLAFEDRAALEAERTFAAALVQIGQGSDAVDLLTLARDTAIAAYGEDDGLSLSLGFALVQAMEDVGDFAAALALADRLTSVMGKVPGYSIRNRLRLANLRGMLLEKLGRFEEAVPALSQTASDRAQAFGASDGETLGSQFLRARALGKAGQKDQAIRELRDLAPALVNAVGERHPTTLHAKCALVRLLAETGQTAEARTLLKALVPLLRETLTDAHPDTRAMVRLEQDLAASSTNIDIKAGVMFRAPYAPSPSSTMPR